MRSFKTFQFTKQPFIPEDDSCKIESVNFSMFSASDISKMAEVQVFKGVYYDESKKPIATGLLDPKMGPANKIAGICATCHGNFENCQGHYGYIALALPVFNIGYIGAIQEVLKCICKSCSRILLPEKDRIEYLKKMRKVDVLHRIDVKKKIMKRFSNIKEIMCFRCGYVNGKVMKGASPLVITHSFQNQNSVDEDRVAPICNIIHPRDALLLFNQMLDQDCELFCLADRPEKLIVSNLLVPPVVIRPSVFVDGGTLSNENDITERLKRIIQANASLCQKMEASCNFLNFLDDWNYLQVEVAQYINSDVRVASQQSTKPLSGFVQRLKGKQGRFRENLSGKRVEFTGRTVISPDPNLKITEVAVPLLMAKILTYPELVNHHNIEKLKQCVQNGPKNYPGAKFVVESNGDKRDLSFGNRKRIADGLKFGYTVHRFLEDGDVLLFNRQPSLHRMSMMCHRARIMPWKTLRFNESVCNPYNADFDGDEMNIHIPQTQEARAEALMLMGVQNNLCTPKNGTILVASTQDFLTSSFLITRKDTFYDRAAFSLMCSYLGDGMNMVDLPTPALIKPIELWTGKQIFNVLLRPHAKMKVFVNLIVKEKIYTRVEDRKTGIREETMCPNDGFVYFRNSELISGQLGKATLGNGNKVGLFSVLVRDYNAYAAAACMNQLAKLSARWIGNHGFSIGIDDVQPGKNLTQRKEGIISNGECDKLIKSYSEGKLPLMPGFDAAQTLEAKITHELNNMREAAGKVCMEELHWRNSPLIMSQCGSKGSPINISQMVACVGQQTVGGCRAPDGFIDCSLPHFQRKSKAPEAKGFVANSFYTGLTATEFYFHTMGGREGLVDTAVKTATTGYMSRRLIKCLEDLAVQYDMTVRNSSGFVIQFLYGDDGMDPAQMEGTEGFPLDFERLYLKVEATCPDRSETLSPSEISEIIHNRLSKHDATSYGAGSDAFKKKLLEFFEKLCQRRCCVSTKQLQVFLDACISRLQSKGIEAGTGIGAIGAQSIGEPGTQMTLKTFHFAGVASMNVTLGVPRINEIINASKKIKFPIIMAKLEDEKSMEVAQTVRGQIEKTMLGQVAKSIMLVMKSVGASILIKLDMEKIHSLRLFINAHIVKEKILKSLRAPKDHEMDVIVGNDSKLAVKLKGKDTKGAYFPLNQLKNKLPMVIVKGISTVERAIITDEEGKIGKLNLIVEGTGLREVMGILGIKGCETESNHVVEVQQTLGIEAARSSIIKEIRKVMKSHAMDVDTRHMMLLADVMTFKGEILGVNRYGITQMKESVLTLSSFEKTDSHLFNGSLHGRKDEIKGVGECIIMGIPSQIGTGSIKIRQRMDPLPTLIYGPDLIVS